MVASDAKALAGLRRLRDDFTLYAPECLRIKAKSGETIPLALNKAQQYVHQRLETQKAETGKVRALLLKARQQGFSTYIGGRFYHRTSLNHGVQTFILTHEQPATDALFGMVERFHKHTPLRPSTGAANAKELFFDKLDAGYGVGTAGTKAVGRSKTIHLFHGCLSPDTLIVDGLTDALRPMGSFSIGDQVRTHAGHVAPISFISRQTKAANCITVKGLTQFPLVATNEHRFWTQDGWRELSMLRTGDKLGFPVVEIISRDFGWPFRLSDTPRPQGGGTRETGPDAVSPTYDLGRVLGLFLAEGCVIKQGKTKVPSAITFTVHEREVERTIAWLKPLEHLFRCKPAVAIRKDSKTVNVTVYGRSFATFVRNLCGELDGKRFPAEWRTCGQDFVRGLIHGYLAGDGHSSKRQYDRRISAPSIRAAITVGMRDALASLGYGWACIGYQKAEIRNGRDEREQFVLRLCGHGVDRLCQELGWEMPPRKRSGSYGDVEISGGYAWLPIVNVEPVGAVEVMDFEVDHPDHSYCTVHAATHNSEVAFWPNAAAHFAGVVQAVPDLPGTEVILESTANGVGGEFHERWQQAEAGIGDYIAIFVPWFWSDEYRRPVPDDFVATDEEAEYADQYELDLEQIVWRRAKMAELKDPMLFKQEYPATAAEAFQTTGHDSFIKAEDVLRARKNTVVGRGPLVCGGDPARFGNDRFSIAWRQGRKVTKIESKAKLDVVQGANWIRQVIDQDKPKRFFVDVGGLGAGVVDILHNWGAPYDKIVVAVNFGSAPYNPNPRDKDGKPSAGYVNRRAEMWGLSRDWLQDVMGADIPDLDSLQADACGPAYKYDMNQRVQLESKEKMRERGVRSPDEWDAVVLTFAEPVNDATRPAKLEIPRVGVV